MTHLCGDEWVVGQVDACPSPNHSRFRSTRWRRAAALGRHSVEPSMEKFWATGDPSVFTKPGTLGHALTE
jgi:hypothetical protein